MGAPSFSPTVQVKPGENEEFGPPKQQEEWRSQQDNLKAEEGHCGLREVTPSSIALVAEARKENQVSQPVSKPGALGNQFGN